MELSPLTIIPAGAGSGKTYKIQTQLTKWVKDGAIKPERIIAVTFTEAAAGELRERIRYELLTDPEVDMEQVLALDQAYITTIHGFGLRLIQEYCFEGGWSPLPRLVSEDEGDILIRQALAVTRKADDIMANLYRYGYKWDRFKGSAEDQFRNLLSRLIQKHRVIGLYGISKRIRSHLHRRIKSLYGRTGDAKALENSLLNGVKRLLKVFPDCLADEYPDNGTYVKAMKNDFKKLRTAIKKGEIQQNWQLWLDLQELRGSKRGSAQPDGYEDLAEAVMEAARQLYRHPGPLDEALFHAEAIVNAAQDCLQHHTDLKQERGLVDYGDMLSLAHKLLSKIPDSLQDLSDRVDCVVIDEFQDTNPLQFSLLWALYRQGIPTLVVGDVKQAIMGFQDADSRLLEEISRTSGQSAPLTDNWRTVKPLMNFLNGAGKGLFPESYQELSPQVTAHSKYKPLHLLNFSAYPPYGRHSFYGDHVAAHIKDVLKAKKKVLVKDGGRRVVQGRDIAILLPTHKLIETYATSFREAGLQVHVDEDGWFGSRAVQLLYYGLLYAADPSDRHAALYLAVTELGDSSLTDSVKKLINGEDLPDSVLAALDAGQGTRDVYTMVSEVTKVLDLFSVFSTWPDAAQQRVNILRFLAEAEEFTAINPETLEASGLYGSGLKTFLVWLQNRSEADDTLPRAEVVNNDAITLTTWHSAKGREWPIVAVCGTFKEYNAKLPSLDIQYKSFDDLDKILQNAVIEYSPNFTAPETVELFKQPLQEEAEDNARRLLYVAMTRAKEHLILERAGFYEPKVNLTYWKLLCDCTKMSISDKSVVLSNEKISSSQTTIAKDPADLENEEPEPEITLPRLGLRAIQANKLSATTPASLSPSQITTGKKPAGAKIVSYTYGEPLQVALDKNPVETGTIIHRCFEVLSGQEDRTHLLNNATGYDFTKKQQQELQATVTSFENWCHEQFGAVELHKEIPITYQNEEGALVSGIIDLLIESEDGYWIIDHKTHVPDDIDKEFWDYWPQLHAYCDGVDRISGKKRVIGVGVSWVAKSIISLNKWYIR